MNLEMNEVAKEFFREWLFSNLISKTLNPLTNKQNYNELELQ